VKRSKCEVWVTHKNGEPFSADVLKEHARQRGRPVRYVSASEVDTARNAAIEEAAVVAEACGIGRYSSTSDQREKTAAAIRALKTAKAKARP
jgi:signal recognition particle GTPase